MEAGTEHLFQPPQPAIYALFRPCTAYSHWQPAELLQPYTQPATLQPASYTTGFAGKSDQADRAVGISSSFGFIRFPQLNGGIHRTLRRLEKTEARAE